MNKQSVYERITDRIIEKLESGVVPWKATWKGAGLPLNGVSKNLYRGINTLLLYSEGYASPYWVTFKQAKELGGSVKEGEKGTQVVFWKWLEVKDEESKEEKKIPLLRHYTVFNALQCDGLKLSAPELNGDEPQGIEGCEAVVREFLKREKGLTLEHKKSHPFYLPLQDLVNVPQISKFNSAEDYYLTLFHELCHSTGHAGRLDRDLKKPRGFASKEYSKEELIAELGACFLAGYAGIEGEVLDDSASYINGWIKALKGDSKLLVHAGAQAQRAVDFILGQLQVDEEV